MRRWTDYWQITVDWRREERAKRKREECGDWCLIRRQSPEQTGVDLQSWRQCRIVTGARAANKASQYAPTPSPTPTPTASPIATTRSHLASQLFCGIIAVTFVLALLVVIVVILVILVVVLADCAAIVFKNKIKMVLAIADSLEW